MQPTAKIISQNEAGGTVCACAARISTTAGGALALFASAPGGDKNTGLVRKVVRSGHTSVLEHAVFTLALENVSVFLEQFFIEFRLAAFTVKSRRYVDFSNQGYYVPPELDGALLADYRRYMDGLFEAYGALLSRGVPKEDARFLLPYAFHSSFYCTLNARELIRLIRAARRRAAPELREIAGQLASQLLERFPAAGELLAPEDAPPPPAGPVEDGFALVSPGEAGRVTMLQYPREPERLLEAAWRAAHPGEAAPEWGTLALAPRPRELEQLSYTFELRDLTLAALTHLTRHRMQSPVIPPLERIARGRQILPESVRRGGAAREIYESALSEARERRERLCAETDPAYHGYFLTSGTLAPVVTTMNARELLLFIRLRSCNRAQWEIRNVALRLLEALKPTFPALFSRYGPACYLTGECPEGALSCGKPWARDL